MVTPYGSWLISQVSVSAVCGCFMVTGDDRADNVPLIPSLGTGLLTGQVSQGKVFSRMWGSFPLWGMVVSAVVCFPGTALKSFVLLLMLISQGKKKSLQYCVKELWGSPAVEFSEDLQYLHSPGCAGLGASRCDSHKPLIRLGFAKCMTERAARELWVLEAWVVQPPSLSYIIPHFALHHMTVDFSWHLAEDWEDGLRFSRRLTETNVLLQNTLSWCLSGRKLSETSHRKLHLQLLRVGITWG